MNINYRQLNKPVMRLPLKKIFFLLNITAVVGFILTSCEKVSEPEPFTPDRMFTPATISATAGETSAVISWSPSLFSGGDVTYKMEVFNNATFTGNPVYTIDTDTTAVTVLDTDLQVRTNYWARVKANPSGSVAGSTGWVGTINPFRMTGEQLFLPVQDATVTDVSVLLRWQPSPDFTKITITPNGGSTTDHPLTAGDISAAQKTISGLTPLTTYTAELFKGAASKGIVTFTTKSATPSGPNVINVGPTDDLATMLTTAAVGSVFILPNGSLYTADAIVNLPAGASFTIWGAYGATKPVIAFNGINLGATAGTIRFENVDLTGYQNNNPSGTKRNYIFNQSAANTTQAIEFENCTVRNFVNTPLRLQGSAGQTINNVSYNKCTVYDIGNNGANGTYALVHTNVATGKVNNIRITNSTLYQIGYSVILHNAAPSVSVLIENCTIDNSIGDGRYLIDYNAQSISGSFLVNNMILGKTLSPANTARGIRAANAPGTTNNYQVSNAIIAGNAIPGIISYAGTNTDLFTNPGAGNFLIKDANFAGKSTAGDPKWRL
jgi:hypothetical protein